jgi:hypothetical protein
LWNILIFLWGFMKYSSFSHLVAMNALRKSATF